MAAYETSLGGDYLPPSLTLMVTAIEISPSIFELCDHFDISQASGHQTSVFETSMELRQNAICKIEPRFIVSRML